jgi:hypothetical protein
MHDVKIAISALNNTKFAWKGNYKYNCIEQGK